MRSRRSRSWAVLIAGLLVVGLAAWLLRRENPGPEATSTPSPDAGRETGWAARWTIDGDTLDIERDGQVVRLRLLNIDAPERRTADHGPQCQAEAAANARGLHDPKENCSLPAHVVSLEGRAHGIPPEDAAGRGALSTDAATVLADLTSARPRAGVAALTAAERDDLVTRTRAVLTAIQK